MMYHMRKNMRNDAFFIGVMGILLYFCALSGWIFAHNTVATECEKLNAFYVGNKVYHCEVKK